MTVCSCWVDYPNESHIKKNGKWKCVDYYENIYTGLCSSYRCRTKCRMKGERMSKEGVLAGYYKLPAREKVLVASLILYDLDVGELSIDRGTSWEKCFGVVVDTLEDYLKEGLLDTEQSLLEKEAKRIVEETF